ncbi:beta-ketoacyl synthase chain length factor [Caldimonas brevitalea]|uniref:3-oxoacyl-[ACP] synthase n=1 Tax=Caldimonas brevitalea TaxID=413882 RepID=A0A0G3BVB0_9BURK|nr:beta-ketoacyl synthase chain length factor [Caldimonas brevitalea]AKJ30475.1 3-oxoacyl-[ACP] synthase [Caldimonas brevitalea]
MSAVSVKLLGIGLIGPGLTGWAAAREVLAGQTAHLSAPTAVPSPQRLPAAERRRAGVAIKVAMAAAEEACADAGLAPQTLPTVFTSSSGDGVNCHTLCEALAGSDRLISPTRFTNSVHNAAAGYWHIGVAGQAPSTSLCAYDASFGAGLVEAVTQVRQHATPLLLVASDTPYPEPLQSARPLPDSFGLGLVFGPADGAGLTLSVNLVPANPATRPTPCADPGLEAMRRALPSARALPLLEAVARGGAVEQVVLLEYQASLHLRVEISGQGPT